MAVLDNNERRRITLAARTSVGRAPDNQVHIQHPKVSAYHAVIVWAGSGWLVRDLASTNGTFVGSRRIEEREAPIRLGTEVSFSCSGWVLVSDAPPMNRAIRRDTGRTIEQGDNDVLILATKPDLIAVTPLGNGWALNKAGRPIRTVHDQETVSVAGVHWVLELCPPPEFLAPTERRPVCR